MNVLLAGLPSHEAMQRRDWKLHMLVAGKHAPHSRSQRRCEVFNMA